MITIRMNNFKKMMVNQDFIFILLCFKITLMIPHFCHVHTCRILRLVYYNIKLDIANVNIRYCFLVFIPLFSHVILHANINMHKKNSYENLFYLIDCMTTRYDFVYLLLFSLIFFIFFATLNTCIIK